MNRAALRSRIQNLLNRSDLTDDLANQFISDVIQRIQRTLRTPMNEVLFPFQISQAYPEFGLPVDFLELISLTYYDENDQVQSVLDRVPIAVLEEKKQVDNSTGIPRFFARKHLDILVHPTPETGSLYMYYYAEFPDYQDNTDDHVLATVAPDLLTYGALSFAADYFIDDRGPLFEQRYQNALTEIQDQSDRQHLSGGIQTIQPAYQY